MSNETCMRVLLIVDDPDDAGRIRERLADAPGFPTQVTHAPHLAQALERLRHGDFDVVLLGLRLAEAGQLDALRAARADLPVVVLAPGDDPEAAVRAVRQGAQDCLARERLTRKTLVRSLRCAVERHQLLRRLETNEQRYALAAEAAADGIWDWDLTTNRILFSPRWRGLIGHADHEIGTVPEEWLRRVHPVDRERLEARIAAHLEGRTEHLEDLHRLRHRDGRYLWVQCRALAARDASGQAIRLVGAHADVSKHKETEAALLHDAYQDPLTGLPNRLHFLKSLERLLSSGPEQRWAVLLADLDGFQRINRSLGHPFGDRVLQVVARRLESCVHPGDLVARLGGDKFGILLPEIATTQEALRLAHHLHGVIAAPITVGHHTVPLSVSVGIADSTSGCTQAEEALRGADLALYQARALGKGQHILFDREMHARSASRLQLEGELREAIGDPKNLLLLFDPVVACDTGRITGFEAQAHWRHPRLGLMGPEQLLPLAEETGLIAALGKWVLTETCAEAAGWQRHLPPNVLPSVSVRISSRQLTLDFVAGVEELLQRFALEGSGVTFHLALGDGDRTDVAATDALLRRLTSLGVRLCLDHFGSGPSSLGYLGKGPFEGVRLCPSFLAALGAGSDSTEIVRTLVTLARTLGLATLAPGVHALEQFSQLRVLGCHYAQGPLLTAPVPAAGVMDLLQKRPYWFLRSSLVNNNS